MIDKIIKKFSNSSKTQLDLFKHCLKISLHKNRSCLLCDVDGDTLLMGGQIYVVLNILKWLEEK